MSLFTENDTRLLEKTLQIREALVDNLIKKELPTNHKDIDSFTNLLESIDRSILGKAKIKVEDSNAKANEETKEILRGLLLDLHRNNTANVSTASANRSEIPTYKPMNMELNPGELILKQDDVSPQEVLGD